MNMPFNLNKGLYLEHRNVLLPWWEAKDFDRLRKIGNPKITTGSIGSSSSTYGSCDTLRWENDCIFHGIPVSIETQDYIVKNFYRIRPMEGHIWSEDEYHTLKGKLIGKFGNAFGERQAEDGLLSVNWKFDDVNIGLSTQERCGVATNFTVCKDDWMRTRPFNPSSHIG
ncbi:MAG: hypothetical protein HOP01_06110 [Gallionella sp.]|nr:hypothetical protein [Gallionella sp.]